MGESLDSNIVVVRKGRVAERWWVSWLSCWVIGMIGEFHIFSGCNQLGLGDSTRVGVGMKIRQSGQG